MNYFTCWTTDVALLHESCDNFKVIVRKYELIPYTYQRLFLWG